MDLRAWLADDLRTAYTRLERGVLDAIPPERRRELVDGGGIPPVYVLWHMTRHHDVAVNAVLREREEVVHSWTDRIGVSSDLWRGLAEGADLDLVQVLDPDAVGGYAMEVLDSTIAWVEGDDGTLGLDRLDEVPQATDALDALGTPSDDFDWLYGMWSGKPRHWFLSWEAHAHVVTHTGELVSLRNRMGLSPF